MDQSATANVENPSLNANPNCIKVVDTFRKGAIANILARAEVPLLAAAEPIADAVRASPVVGSDETSARVGGKTPAFAGAGMVAMGAAWLNCDLPCDRRHARGIGGDIVHRGCASRGLGG